MNILWLKTELLHPVDKGGKIRTYHMLKELKRQGHRVTYLTLDDGSAAAGARASADEYCDELVCVPHALRPKFSAGFYYELARNLASPLPYAIKKYESAAMRRLVGERAARGDCDVLVCDFLTPAVNAPGRLPLASVLFEHNVEAMIWRRHYEVQANPLKKAYLRGQWAKMRRFEREACRRFDAVVAVSREDREVLEREYGLAEVSDVPTGVDTEFFRPRAGARPRPHNLVFTGSMDWLPNEDAMRYFTADILPLVEREVPDVTLTVVGRNPSPGLVELGRRNPRVVVTGRVEDVRPYMEEAAAYVIPLRIGGGTRLKAYEAMAMGTPMVSTAVGVEGLPVRDGAELLVADAPEDFARAVLRLLRDRELARRISERAAATVRASFGWDRVAESFAAACERAARARGVARRAGAAAAPDATF